MPLTHLNEWTTLSNETDGKQGYLRRLLRFLSVAVSDDPRTRGRGLTELARATGIPLSTASRLAALLTDAGMLRTLPAGGYGPGAELIRIAGSALVSLRGDSDVEAVIRELVEHTGESASAGMLVGDVIVLVSREEPDHSLRAVARIGDSIAPHTSAMGKAILATLPAERRLALLRRAVGAEAGLFDQQLEAELEEVRRVGYALDEETYSPGLRCRAAAFQDGQGNAIGGISIAGPAARFTHKKASQCIPQLTRAADQLSAAPADPKPIGA
jgi:DNA-binding IclR family transcriptional regulator